MWLAARSCAAGLPGGERREGRGGREARRQGAGLPGRKRSEGRGGREVSCIAPWEAGRQGARSMGKGWGGREARLERGHLARAGKAGR